MKLSALEDRVYTILSTNVNQDVPIETIFALAYPNRDANGMTVRDKQQRLGYLFARINAKLEKGQIKTGDRKQTYRLCIKSDDG